MNFEKGFIDSRLSTETESLRDFTTDYLMSFIPKSLPNGLYVSIETALRDYGPTSAEVIVHLTETFGLVATLNLYQEYLKEYQEGSLL